MGDVPQLIKIGISLKIQPNNGPVFFKVDGSRFGQNRTIKLLTGSKYKIEVVVKPGAVEATDRIFTITGVQYVINRKSVLQTLVLELKKRKRIDLIDFYSTMGIGGVNFPLEQQSKDPQSVVYSGVYDTEGVMHTKSGERQPVQVNIQFNEVGYFETVWQVKYYNYHKRDHCQWGNSFSCIEYECKPNETRSLMWINKEMFI